MPKKKLKDLTEPDQRAVDFSDEAVAQQKHKGVSMSARYEPMDAPPVQVNRDPLFHLMGAMTMGMDGHLDREQRVSQRELARQSKTAAQERAPTNIPKRLMCCTDEDLIKAGFKLGPRGTLTTEIFRPAVMPEGWRFVQTDHGMWSDLVDGAGFVRGSMFYKSAFYDRSAHLGLNKRFTTREDRAAADVDGTLRGHVIARLPGKKDEDGHIVHTMTYPVKFPGTYHVVDESMRRAYFEASDQFRKDLSAWLATNYPDSDSVHAYWDMQFGPSETAEHAAT